MEKFFEELKNPGSLYRGAPFWAWNGKLETEELRRQIRIMKEMGLGGFFMHSRVGLDTPYLSEEWFECINACADEGEKNKMLAFLYDEDRWPSGAAGGLVTKNKKYRMRHMFMKITENSDDIKREKNVFRVFLAEFEGGYLKNYRRIKKGEKVNLSENEKILIFSVKIQKESDWYNGYTYLDTLNPEAVKQFIKITYENYKKHCGKYFGSVIPGIFTDEPNYGCQFFILDDGIGISWTDKLPVVFQKRYGYDICDKLPEIYFNFKNEKISKTRYHYFDCITYLFVDSFAKQIGTWCEKNKILFTGHILGEDSLTSQTYVVGSCMRFYEYMQAPGMDLLTEHWRIFNTAKQVSSVARQFGRKFRLTETYGCTGWDFPFVGHKALGDWQAALGINLRCQHLSWYTMLGEAKRDYPASIFYQSPWWNTYKYVEDYFARIHLVMTQGEEIRDLLVIHPVESMWSVFKMPSWKGEEKKWEYSEEVKKLDEIFVELCDILLSNHIDFDYGDEEILTRWAKIQKKEKDAILKVNIAEYKAVLVPPLYTIRSSTLKLLKKFREEGGMVIFVENIPSFVDCQFSDEVKKFAENCIVVQSIEESLKHLEKIRRISIKDENGKEIREILYLLREDRNYFYLFLCNTSMEWDKNISKYYPVIERKREFKDVIIKAIPEWGYRPVEINPQTGEIYYPETIKDENGYKIKTDFPPIASHLYIIPKKKEIGLKIEEMKKYKTVRSLKIEKEKWDYFLTEKNVLVLDIPYFKIKDGEWQEKKEILKVDREVRKYLGLSQRGGAMIQPWARKISKNPKSVKVSLKYEFYVEELPEKEISIAIEKPELYSIYINNFKLSTDMKNGWWVDKSLETISFEPSILRKGENEILLETYYNENHPGFEIIYLLGDFGVKLEDKKPVIISLPENLKTGDWTGQGLPFYSGNIGYLLQIEKIDFNEKERVFLRIPEFRGVGVRIFIDGKEVGILAWEPYEIDITEYIKGKEKSNLIIEILGHRRNSHGPLHYFEKWPVWTGPGQFVSEGEQWTDEYQIVPCGLMKNPEILIKKENV
jgi:hypothetical protein